MLCLRLLRGFNLNLSPFCAASTHPRELEKRVPWGNATQRQRTSPCALTTFCVGHCSLSWECDCKEKGSLMCVWFAARGSIPGCQLFAQPELTLEKFSVCMAQKAESLKEWLNQTLWANVVATKKWKHDQASSSAVQKKHSSANCCNRNCMCEVFLL